MNTRQTTRSRWEYERDSDIETDGFSDMETDSDFSDMETDKMKDCPPLYPSREEMMETRERRAGRERRAEREQRIPLKDKMVESDSDIETDDDGPECIPIYNHKNDYDPHIDCNYVNEKADRTAVDYIHLSLHSRGFIEYIRAQTYEHEQHMEQVHRYPLGATAEDKRLEYIHGLYNNATDCYLERHGRLTYGRRGIRDISEEELHKCQQWVKLQHILYQNNRIATLSDIYDHKIDKIESWEPADEEYAERAHTQYLEEVRRNTEGAYARCAYITYLTKLELIKPPEEHDTHPDNTRSSPEREAHHDERDSVMESNININIVGST